ncbi:hypothetical protein A9A72_124225 [Stutzerimonas stutzeri]|jgi:hypothetical protein|uniref:Uncharacterized protein n=1 Tax=Stutzerimonas stutzeri TaxID=316 RepID=A0A5S5B3Q9_STUST|nr:hypothetical protein A9A72_124225 [Stutzerimonas stutzeri]
MIPTLFEDNAVNLPAFMQRVVATTGLLQANFTITVQAVTSAHGKGYR